MSATHEAELCFGRVTLADQMDLGSCGTASWPNVGRTSVHALRAFTCRSARLVHDQMQKPYCTAGHMIIDIQSKLVNSAVSRALDH